MCLVYFLGTKQRVQVLPLEKRVQMLEIKFDITITTKFVFYF